MLTEPFTKFFSVGKFYCFVYDNPSLSFAAPSQAGDAPGTADLITDIFYKFQI
ncbi:hypothetical protein CLOHYLEM_05174 [[Clostridium] hylemonae DSM 15053]|uniref:Uncharacterized protein n=1 Tax=[Clostridium] hylemonae DSM 15053 TaxID=553973 RepID=C0BZD4_9FIRM|nr:hypothetical protein CLOHYLEM_05174 [[Clostridium] hylemonae DSM 15053]